MIDAGRVLKELDAHAIATESIYDHLTDQQLANHFFGDDIHLLPAGSPLWGSPSDCLKRLRPWAFVSLFTGTSMPPTL